MNFLRRRRRLDYLLLVLSTFLLHGLLLLNDGIYVDGWLYWSYLSARRWDLLFSLSAQQGVPQTASLYRALALFPDFILAHKLLAFSCLLLSALLIYRLARELQLLTRQESFFLALFTLAFPAYQFGLEISHIWNLLPYTLFLGGWLLALRAEQYCPERRERCLAYRLLALLAFLFCFMNPSLLAYYQRRNDQLTAVQAIRRLLRQRLALVVLPLVYWATMRVAFPPHGVFVDYNELALSNLARGGIWWEFVGTGIVDQFTKSLSLIPLSLFVLVSFTVLLVTQSLKLEQVSFFSRRATTASLAFFALVLSLLAALPFVVVGKTPTLHGFNTRITLLLGLPVAILLLVLTRLLFSAGKGQVHRTGYLFMTTLFLAFWLAQTNAYLAWQARWVKDRSIFLNLETHQEVPECATVYVDDQYLFKQWRRSIPHEASMFLNRRYFQE